MNSVLDPAAAAEAGRAHGQIASAGAGGTIVVSAHKIVEIGARAQLLVVPGLLRFDARPLEDSLQVMTRAIGPVLPRWEAEDNPPQAYGEPSPPGAPYRASWRLEVGGEQPLEGRVQLLTTLDLAAGARHFALHAVIGERGRMRVRST